MKNERILILHVIDSLRPGGAEKIVYNLATRIDKSRFAVSVCSFDDTRDTFIARSLEKSGVRISFLGRRSGFDPALPVKIRSYIRRNAIDIVHCHIGGEFYGHIGATATRARVLTTLHGIFPYSLKRKALIRFLNVFKRNYKVAVSRELESLYSCDYLIYNGIDIPAAGEEETRDVQEFNLSPTDILVGIIGRLSEVKNHKNFLDAARIVSDRTDGVKFLIVGSGPLKGELEDYAGELGIGERTVFTGYREDIDSLIGMIDISVLSSDSEGLPMVVLESMAAAKPVVATEVGGIPELITDGETGVLVRPKDPAALAGAILRLVEDEDLRKTMGGAAKVRIEDVFSTETMIERYEDLYGILMRG